MKLAMVLCLVLAAACKTDGAGEQSASTSNSAASSTAPSESATKPRSGKIDPPPRLNGAPPVEDMPTLSTQDLTEEERMARRQAREERREERRKERMERLDANKDGDISPEELEAGRKQRTEDMRTRFDANGDGKLTVEELGEGRMGRRLDVATIDANKDGDISAEELGASMQKMREQFRDAGGARGRGWRNRLDGSNAGSGGQPQ